MPEAIDCELYYQAKLKPNGAIEMAPYGGKLEGRGNLDAEGVAMLQLFRAQNVRVIKPRDYRVMMIYGVPVGGPWAGKKTAMMPPSPDGAGIPAVVYSHGGADVLFDVCAPRDLTVSVLNAGEKEAWFSCIISGKAVL